MTYSQIMKIHHFLLLCFLFCGIKFSYSLYSKKSGVVSLNHKNFDQIIKGKNKELNVVLVKFYAPWCGHCQAMTADFEKTSKSLTGMATVAALDCTDEKNSHLVQKFRIQGYPTLKIFIDGKPMDYEGQRDANSMISFVKSKFHSKYITSLNSQKRADEFLNLELKKLVLFTDKFSTSALFKSLSMKYGKMLRFGEVKVKKWKDLAEKYGITKFPYLMIFPDQNEREKSEPIHYTGVINAKSIHKFIKTNVLAESYSGSDFQDQAQILPELFDQSCFEKYCVKSGKLCAILLTNTNTLQSKKAGRILEEIVELQEDDSFFSFVKMNGTVQSKFVEKVFGNLLIDEYPQLVVLNYQRKLYLHFIGAFDVKSIHSFLSGIMIGKQRAISIGLSKFPLLVGDSNKCGTKGRVLKKFDRNYVVTLTDSNFTEFIQESKLPVMVEFYAPQCGHCKSLAPKQNKASQNLDGMVIFAIVDATVENKLATRFDIKGFPTILSFHNDVNNPSEYQGQRTARSLVDYATNLLDNYQQSIELFRNEKSTNGYDSLLKQLENDSNLKVVLMTEKQRVPSMVKALALQYQDHAKFSVVSNLEKAKKYFGITSKLPQFVVKRQVKEKDQQKAFNFYNGSISFAKISDQVLDNLDTSVSKTKLKQKDDSDIANILLLNSSNDLDSKCLKKYRFCIVVLLNDENTRLALKNECPYIKMLQSVKAKTNQEDNYCFVWLPKSGQAEFSSGFDLTDDTPINIVAINGKEKRYVRFLGSLSNENIEDFILNIFSGSLPTSSFGTLPKLNEIVLTNDGKDFKVIKPQKQEIGEQKERDNKQANKDEL